MMKKPCAALIALFCLFTLSLASHAPPETDEPSTKVAVPNGKDFATAAVVDLTKFPLRLINRRFPVRSKRPCRHNRKTRPVEIFLGGENGDFQEAIVPGRWLRVRRHHEHGEGFDRVGGEKGVRVMKKLKKVKGGSFVRRVRKFLDNYL